MEGSNGNVKSSPRTMFLMTFPTPLTSQKSQFWTRNVKKLAYLLYSTLQYLVSEATVYLHTHFKMSQTASHQILTPREEIIQAQEPAVYAKDVFNKNKRRI